MPMRKMIFVVIIKTHRVVLCILSPGQGNVSRHGIKEFVIMLDELLTNFKSSSFLNFHDHL